MQCILIQIFSQSNATALSTFPTQMPTFVFRWRCNVSLRPHLVPHPPTIDLPLCLYGFASLATLYSAANSTGTPQHFHFLPCASPAWAFMCRHSSLRHLNTFSQTVHLQSFLPRAIETLSANTSALTCRRRERVCVGDRLCFLGPCGRRDEGPDTPRTDDDGST